MNARAFASAGLVWVALTAHAHAQEAPCAADIEPTPEVRANFVDPLSGDDAIAPFTLRLRGGGGACRYELALRADHDARALMRDDGPEALSYVVARDAAGHDIVFDSARASESLARPAFADDRLDLFLIARNTPGLRAGAYDARLSMRAIAVGDESADAGETALPLAAFAPAQVEAFLSGTASAGGAYALLDLGELSAGLTGQARLRVRASAPVRVAFESAHQGQLQHEDIADQRIEYELSASGVEIDLDVDGAALSDVMAGDGVDMALNVRIGETSRAASGRYRDRITITISAQ